MTDNAELQSAPVADCSSVAPMLVAFGLIKQFPGVRALDNVDFSISPGEIVALLGQNGAGKSTLIQIFAGAHPTGSFEGSVSLNGRPYQVKDVAQAEAAGVALVPQEVNTVPDLSVAENITLNNEPIRWSVIDVGMRLRMAQEALASFAIDVDPLLPMSALDLASQQLVVIARALSKKVRLLILDEPTAALTEHESLLLFDRMRALKRRGVAIIFVSHRLAEVFAISDRVVVMRDGRIRGRHKTTETTRGDIVTEMIGETARVSDRLISHISDETALETRSLNVFESDGRQRVNALNLAVRKGEVVGLFGLLGAGCMEAALAVFGAWKGRREGIILVEGKERAINSPTEAVALGLGLMAQDRRDCLIADQSIGDNIAIASLDKIIRFGMLDTAESRRRSQTQIDALRIKAASIDAEVRTLSGGNQQKVQIARWLAANTRILIMVDPTRGVDVGARREIKRIWLALSAKGQAILLASTDAEELVDACDRVVVMRQGRQVGELSGPGLTEKNLLRMATDG